VEFLSRILEAKRLEVEKRSARRPIADLERLAREMSKPRDFLGQLRGPGLGVIAEIKRASPSRGPLRPQLDAPALAREYSAGGCMAISVLTDSAHFGARPDDLPSVRAAVSVPVLKKDFHLSEYQIWEARAEGADALLLIAAALDQPTLAGLIAIALRLGICPLVEVHTASEVGVALDCGAPVIGINNRDLASFRVDLETTRRLRPLIPDGIPVVAESGIRSPEDARRVGQWGADAVLVGEALVCGDDPRGMVRSMSAGIPSLGRECG